MKKQFTVFFLATIASLNLFAQEVLSLEDCRQLALENNKQIQVAKLQKDVASDNRQSARTKYLPRVDAVAGYELMSREVSILSEDQKTALNNLGTNAMTKASPKITELMTSWVQQGLFTPQQAQALQKQLEGMSPSLMAMGNELGNTIREAFRTNNRNMFAGSVIISQPVYMGGSITALNKMADIGVDMADNTYDLMLQNTLYEIDAAYWLVVSLRHKQRLAESFYTLVKKLEEDVQKLIKEGLATQADGLNIGVRVNEAEMNKLKVDDNLTLSKMLLCQLCGLPMNKAITLKDETEESLSSVPVSPTLTSTIDRPELRLLQNTIDLSEQSTKIITATYYRPQVAVTGGFVVNNPSVYNGFEHKFAGMWNIGLMVRMPIWNWNEGRYKLHSAKAATHIAQMQREDLNEKINLQVEQQRFKVSEATRRLELSKKHLVSAEENLRCANLGFREGVMSLTDVMTAQTAWEAAQNQRIDAEIEVQLSQVSLRKALGQLP
jgi:outer membrane protein TolC